MAPSIIALMFGTVLFILAVWPRARNFFATERNIFPAGREKRGAIVPSGGRVEKGKVEKDVTNRRDRRKWIDRSFPASSPSLSLSTFQPLRRRC